MGIKDVKEVAGRVAEKISGKTIELGNEAANQAKKGMQVAQKAAEDTNRNLQLKRLSPLFPDDYSAQDFTLPEMVVVADGTLRKDEEVCEGAIGWTGKAAQLSVVHLYKTFVKDSGITFFPSAKIDSVYMADPSNPQRYIDLGCFFSTIEDEKAAELIEIGRCLGAKKCSVETFEAEKQVSLKKGDVKAKGKSKSPAKTEVDVSVEGSAENEQQKKCNTLSVQECPGSDTPQRPTLHWFANDTAITNLIDSFFDGRSDLNPTKVRREVSRSSSCTMNSKMAGKVDAALVKLGARLNFSIDGEAKREERQTWTLEIEF